MVAAALLWSSASAQVGAEAVKTAARTWTEAEVLQMAGLQPAQRSISWGRFVRYGGVLVTAGSVIYAALDWFYEEAKRSTGTALDEWHRSNQLGGFPDVAGLEPRYTDSRGPYLWYASNMDELAAAFAGRSNPCRASLWSVERIISPPGSNTAWIRARVSHSGLNTVEVEWANVPASQWESAALAALREAHAQRIATHCVGQTPGVQPLPQHLTANPASMNALRTQVIPGFLADRESGATWPYTYAEPWGPDSGLELDPAPNRNQWYDNPFANPSIDTDGDGFTDAEEAVAGTDPNDPDEFPTVSPWPEPEPGEEPWPDADGDGVPDQWDPCPFDAQNRCADARPSESLEGLSEAISELAAASAAIASNTERLANAVEGIEIPDDYAREPTQQRVATAVEGILDVLREDTGATPTFTPLAAPEPADTSPLASWLPDLSEAEAAWTSYIAQVEADFADLLARTQTAFPFGMGAVLGNVPTVSGSECVAFDFTLTNEVSAPVNLCSVPALDQFLATTGRSVLAALLLVAFIWTSVQTVLRS